MTSNQNLNGWSSFKFRFQNLSFIAESQTSIFQFSLTPYYSSSWDGDHPALRVTLVVRPCRPSGSAKIFWNNAFLLIFIDFFGQKIEKIKIFKNFNFVIFSENFLQPLFGFSNSKKSIDQLFLPDEIYFEPSSIRKWIQIRIWTDEPSFNFDFKTLALPLSRRLHFFNFPWHRITLRVEMETILLYESLYQKRKLWSGTCGSFKKQTGKHWSKNWKKQTGNRWKV